jgi:hypothetical protein
MMRARAPRHATYSSGDTCRCGRKCRDWPTGYTGGLQYCQHLRRWCNLSSTSTCLVIPGFNRSAPEIRAGPKLGECKGAKRSADQGHRVSPRDLILPSSSLGFNFIPHQEFPLFAVFWGRHVSRHQTSRLRPACASPCMQHIILLQHSPSILSVLEGSCHQPALIRIPDEKRPSLRCLGLR